MPLNSLARRSASALIWSYAGAFIRAFAQLAIQVVLARLLGPTAFGQATIVMVVLGVGWLFADAGFGSALIQKAELTENDVRYALGWILTVSVVVGLLISACASLIASAFGDDSLTNMIRSCGLLIPLQALSNLPASILKRNLDMKRQQMIQVGSYVFGYGVIGILLALLGFGPWSLIVGFGAQTLLALAGGYAVVRHPWRPTLKGDQTLRSFGLSIMVINLANWAIDNLDRVVIGRHWSTEGVGAYSAAANLSRAPASLLVSAAQSVVLSTASRLQTDFEKLAKGFSGAVNLVSLLTFPLSCLLGLHADFIIHTLYGNQWQLAAPLFAAFCVAIPSYSILAIAGPMLSAVGLASAELKVQIIVALALVVGLTMLSGYTLAQAVWLIPVLYAVRTGLVVAAFAWRVGMRASRVLMSLVGGIALALCSAASTLMVNQFDLAPMGRFVAAAVGAIALSLIAIRLGTRGLLCADLRHELIARMPTSAAIRRACSILGVAAR